MDGEMNRTRFHIPFLPGTARVGQPGIIYDDKDPVIGPD